MRTLSEIIHGLLAAGWAVFMLYLLEKNNPLIRPFVNWLRWGMAKKKPFPQNVEELTKAQLNAISESSFQSWVMEKAKEHGWWRAHFLPTQIRPGRFVTAQLGEAGFPDVVLVRDGRLLFLELKRMSGVPSDEQIEWIQLLSQIPNVHAGIYRPVDSYKILELLR